MTDETSRSSRPIRRLSLHGSPEDIGGAHGSRYAREISDYAEDRLRLSAEGTALSRQELIALGESCLPAHRAYDPALSTEMEALADAAGIDVAEALILGGYTDFLDVVRAVTTAPVEDNCTAVLTPDDISEGAGFLAQTWDMHASATARVVLADIRPDDGPAALVFTTVGCLGQIGMNEHGVAVGINNLTAADGRIGVTWPFVVRRALRASTADEAMTAVLEADLAGGHNFLILDASGTGYSVEAMPTATAVTVLEGGVVAHTNHCLAPATMAVEAERPDALASSSARRLTQAPQLLADCPVTVDGLTAMLRDERSICRRKEPPHDYESCGAMVMRPRTREVWACWGIPADNPFEHFEVIAHV